MFRLLCCVAVHLAAHGRFPTLLHVADRVVGGPIGVTPIEAGEMVSGFGALNTTLSGMSSRRMNTFALTLLDVGADRHSDAAAAAAAAAAEMVAAVVLITH